MVTTRRKAAEPAQPEHAAPAAAAEQDFDEAPATVVKKTSRRKVTARTPSAPKTVAPTVTTTKATAVAITTKSASTAATTTMAAARRTRSHQTDSPLKSLEDVQQKAPASSAKAPAVMATPLKTKRKYGASHYDKVGGTATPEPQATSRESVQDDSNDEGMFFTQSNQRKSLSLNFPSSPPMYESNGQNNGHVVVPEQRNSTAQLSYPTDSASHLNDSFAFLNDDAYMHEAFTCHQDDTVMFSEGDPITPQRESGSQHDEVPVPPKRVSASRHEEPGSPLTSPYASPSPSTYADHVPAWVKVSAEHDDSSAPYIPRFSGQVSTDTALEAQLRMENYYLRAQLDRVQARNHRLLGDNIELKARNSTRDREIARMKQQIPPSSPPIQSYRPQANEQRPDIQAFGMHDSDEYGEGNAEAFDLLHHVTKSARETRTLPPDSDDESDTDMASLHLHEQQITQSETARKAAETTPSRTTSKPSFLTRSISAIKSRIGWSTPTPPQPSPAPSSTSRAPPPDSFTEVLSTPPTPVGERRQTRPRKQKRNLMLQLLTKGVEPGDMAKAEEWAKQMIPTLKSHSDFTTMRHRLEKPVLLQDLEHLPSSKPWGSGFGDPLGHLDDEDVVPVWAVVLEIISEEEQPKRKRMKANHEVSMGLDDTLSLNDKDRTAEPLHDSHGHSASLMDLHPRRSIQPSPIFSSSSSHQPGSNVFNELRGHEAQTDEREIAQEAAKEAVNTHNPSQGSFGLDYGSDDSEDESTIVEGETSGADHGASPLWTQPPPPAPVPAHAPLPGGSAAAAEAPSTSTEQPMDEIERQRQKLMKHTPAKPSRLREAFVPSPSVLSDAGNQSFLTGTPLVPTNMFDDMPDAEDLGLTSEDWAGVRALTSSEEWKAAVANNVWPDPTYTYASEEEELSPV